MIDFGDGREERMAALDLELKLRRDPEVTRRREDYYRRLREARYKANSLPYSQLVDELIAHNPAYIRELLETEDERFGLGSLADRHAQTFMEKAK